jgi:hypothetical protein
MAFTRIFAPDNTPIYTHFLTPVKAPNYAHFGILKKFVLYSFYLNIV